MPRRMDGSVYLIGGQHAELGREHLTHGIQPTGSTGGGLRMETEEQHEIDFNEWVKICTTDRDNGRDRDTFTAGHIAGAKAERELVLEALCQEIKEENNKPDNGQEGPEYWLGISFLDAEIKKLKESE